MKVQKQTQTVYQLTDVSEADFALMLTSLNGTVHRLKQRLKTESDLSMLALYNKDVERIDSLISKLLAVPD